MNSREHLVGGVSAGRHRRFLFGTYREWFYAVPSIKHPESSAKSLSIKKLKKKNVPQVDEVRHWMETALAARPDSGAYRLLALVGPPGCAKSTMVRLLAQDMGVELAEWQVTNLFHCYVSDLLGVCCVLRKILPGGEGGSEVTTAVRYSRRDVPFVFCVEEVVLYPEACFAVLQRMP